MATPSGSPSLINREPGRATPRLVCGFPAGVARILPTSSFGCAGGTFAIFVIGGSIWLNRFSHGFPITGMMSRKFPFPPAAKKLPDQLPVIDVLASNASRFACRASRPPPQADVLWSDTIDQVERGRMGPPRVLNRSGRFSDDLNDPINVAFRFAVAQTSKVRDCDDLKDSLGNRLCALGAPIALPGWGLLAAMSLFSSSLSTKGWAFLNGGDTSAYKNLPPRLSDSHSAAIGLRGSQREGWFAFSPRTLPFGATASMLRYNVFSRILASIASRFFCIPLIAFYDDLGPPMIRGYPEGLFLWFSRYANCSEQY